MAESFKMTMTPEDKAKWTAKADEDGISLAKWLRNAANAFCEPRESEVKPVASVHVKSVEKPKVKRSGPVSALEAFKHMLPPD